MLGGEGGLLMLEDVRLAAVATVADGVVGNVLAGRLLSLARELTQLMAPGGLLLLTGVLEEEAAQLIEHCAHVGLEVIDRRDGWVLLSGVKTA